MTAAQPDRRRGVRRPARRRGGNPLPAALRGPGRVQDERPARRGPGSILPKEWVLTNYTDVLFGEYAPTFWRQALNSLIDRAVASRPHRGLRLGGRLRLRPHAFRGREALYTLFVFGLLFPSAVAILPLYILVRQLGLSANLLGVALPQAAFALPLTIIILRPFFRSIPAELEDAARIDGCSTFGFFWRILLPLARPALATVSVLAIVDDVERLLPAAGDPQRRRPVDAAARGDELLDRVQLGQGPRPGVHGDDDHPGDRLLRVRRAPHRQRPDQRFGEGLMTTIDARYRDASLPVDARVADLLARMTLDEKLAQLGSVWSFELFRTETELDPERLRPASPTASATSAGSPARRTSTRRRRRGRQRDPAFPRRGDPARASRRSSTRRRSTGLLARDAPCVPAVDRRGGRLRSRAGRGDRGHDPPADAGDRGAARARAGPRHLARSALGPRRGDVRRGPVPRGGARLRLRPRPPGRTTSHGRRGHGQALRRARPRRGRAEPGARPCRAARAARRAAAAVRGGGPRCRPWRRDAGVLRRRRRAVPRLARAADDHPARRVGLRRRRRRPTTRRSRCSSASTA